MTPRTPQTAAGREMLREGERLELPITDPSKEWLRKRILAIEDEARALPDPTEPVDGYAGHDGSDEPVSGMGIVPGPDRTAQVAAIRQAVEAATANPAPTASSDIWDGVAAALYDAGLRSGALPDPTERRAPVQRDRDHPAGSVPWATHLAAWDGYIAAGHYNQSAERLAERGGFSYREAQCAIAGHYNATAACVQLHPILPGWEPR